MNISRLLLSVALLSGAVVMSSSGCNPDDPSINPITTKYNVNNDTLTTTSDVIRSDSTFESDCQNNNKIFVIVSSKINSAIGPLVVVNYNQTTPLAANQIKIDIADGVSTDYLSTGDTTNPSGTLPVTAYYSTDLRVFTLSFNNVPLRQYGSNGPGTTVIRSSGFLSKN